MTHAPRLPQRWGDAPVHSIGASLFAERHQIHFFDDIGYLHYPLQHCPRDEAVRTALECVCDPNGSYGQSPLWCLGARRVSDVLTMWTDYREDSCLRKWEENLDS